MVPVVSVVIAAFDAERTLGEQLAALSRQVVLFPFEVLVCDNGSSDRTIAVAEQWRLGSLPQLRVVDASARRGPGAARNAGAAAALAPLLVFCDADDVVADDWLAEMHSALQTADVVAGRCSYSLLNRSAIGLPQSDDVLFRLAFFPHLPAASSCNLGVRSGVFSDVHGFDESLKTAEDIDFSWRVQLAGHRLESCPLAVVHLRRRGNLRSVFWQSYGYGRGERALRLRYSDVAAAYARDREDIGVPRNPRSRPVPEIIFSAIRQIHRFRGTRDLAFLAKRVGRSLGRSFGAVDPAIVKMAVPPARRLDR